MYYLWKEELLRELASLGWSEAANSNTWTSKTMTKGNVKSASSCIKQIFFTIVINIAVWMLLTMWVKKGSEWDLLKLLRIKMICNVRNGGSTLYSDALTSWKYVCGHKWVCVHMHMCALMCVSAFVCIPIAAESFLL